MGIRWQRWEETGGKEQGVRSSLPKAPYHVDWHIMPVMLTHTIYANTGSIMYERGRRKLGKEREKSHQWPSETDGLSNI